MKNQFVKHSLNSGDTIESVAKQLSVTEDYLMLVHNLNVEIHDKIKSAIEGFPSHLTEIYVNTDILKAIQKQSERRTGHVILAARFYEKRIYGFVLENYENESLRFKVHYQVEMMYLKKEGNQKVLEVNRKQIYINNKEPQVLLEQLANKIFETIFPVQLKISANGEIESIENHQEIKERWTVNRAQLSKYYKKGIAEKIFDKANRYYSNEHILMESLSENWFFNLFFKPIYGSYSSTKEIQYDTNFPIFANNELEFKMKQTLEETYTKSNKIEINSIGKATHHSAIEEVLKNKFGIEKSRPNLQAIQSQAEIQYKLNDFDNSIFSIIGTFRTQVNGVETQRKKVEIYHL